MFAVSDPYGFIERHAPSLNDALEIQQQWTLNGYKGVIVRDNSTGEIVIPPVHPDKA